MLGETQVGGLMKNPQSGTPSAWLVYFFAPELATSTEKAKKLGTTAMMESIPIPGIGAFSLLQDPCGAAFALDPSASAC
jgi:predicted enzyme related to lactoylglutathione lyase